jgi:hypothetical protein
LAMLHQILGATQVVCSSTGCAFYQESYSVCFKKRVRALRRTGTQHYW